ncbi:MAG: tetratricopeptide (TPR) repeat protein [Hyphomicrobiaceae bacterium]|jgi:tetratricopeptide (TPR) repeat protein
MLRKNHLLFVAMLVASPIVLPGTTAHCAEPTVAAAASPTPAQFLDRAKLQDALAAHRWDELDGAFETAQTAYESARSRATEEVVLHALGTFRFPRPNRLEALQAWTEARPQSPFAFAARGLATAEAVRRARGGLESALKSSREAKAWGEAFATAEGFLQQAVAFRPKLSAASCELIGLFMQTRRFRQGDEIFRTARRQDSFSYALRAANLDHLTPNWGGELTGVNAAANSPRPYFPRNPGMEALAGFLPWAIGLGYAGVGDFENAQVHFARAQAEGSDRRFDVAVAEALAREGRWLEAVQAWERANQAWPDHPPYLAAMALAQVGAGEPNEAQATLARVRLLDPDSHGAVTAKRALDRARRGLDCKNFKELARTVLADCTPSGCTSPESRAAREIVGDIRGFLLCRTAFADPQVQAAFWVAVEADQHKAD